MLNFWNYLFFYIHYWQFKKIMHSYTMLFFCKLFLPTKDSFRRTGILEWIMSMNRIVTDRITSWALKPVNLESKITDEILSPTGLVKRTFSLGILLAEGGQSCIEYCCLPWQQEQHHHSKSLFSSSRPLLE